MSVTPIDYQDCVNDFDVGVNESIFSSFRVNSLESLLLYFLHFLLFITRKYEHMRINKIQLRFLHFNQHSITLLGIHMRHWACKRNKYTFINANMKVINNILKVNRDN